MHAAAVREKIIRTALLYGYFCELSMEPEIGKFVVMLTCRSRMAGATRTELGCVRGFVFIIFKSIFVVKFGTSNTCISTIAMRFVEHYNCAVTDIVTG